MYGYNLGLGSGGNSLPRTPGSKSGLELGTLTTSRRWAPNPIPASDDVVAVSGCTYRFDETGSFIGDAGTWGTAKYIELQTTTDSDEYSKSSTGTCTIDSVEYDWTVTTRALDATPTAFSFTDVTDVELETLTESNAITVAGIEVAVAFTVTGGAAEKNDSGTWATSGTVEADDTVKLMVTSSDEYETAVNATLSINGVSDTFTVTTKQYVEPSAGFPFTFPFNLG